MISHCDFAFALWNTLTSPKLQMKYVEEKSSGDESDQHCYMIQGNDSLEVNSDTQLDDSASSSGDDYIDADALNEELFIVCEEEENKNLSSKLDLVLQEKDDISNERDSLKS